MPLPPQMEDALQRSFYTAKNCHAWTMNDHKALVEAVAELERLAGMLHRKDRTGKPSLRAAASQRRYRGRS